MIEENGGIREGGGGGSPRGRPLDILMQTSEACFVAVLCLHDGTVHFNLFIQTLVRHQ